MPAAKGIVIPERVAQRAYMKWEPDENGCYISTYSTASHGYAQIGWQDPGYRQIVLAHRAAWTHVHGQIPEGMTIDHRPTCDRRCVNVSHLRMLTNFENARRTFGRDWPLGQCLHGHDNTHLVREPNGRMRCILCRRERRRRAYRKHGR
ncbi:HNH domain protein [Mycobacterium phage Eureka]|uniref:HNH domain protein n=2 Tax=Kostyavirus eureka TaxID=1074306 RepID=G1JWV1_9CAUD|nr:HNH domain protein [Mycobacterium phage Goku]YP_009591621.1 HNH domain protein [Mycobacterium phage Eureka]AYQ99128.1 HNH endonuclease [Mycobacterium phage BaboJay]AYQ99829.1 HNH endonuclease [Mycobacterium phage Manda]AEL98096.1 HNH domain protein [Mycobacterium phage Eureka]AGT14188.1 HNH domain protein [Mycobacterium phage Goku]